MVMGITNLGVFVAGTIAIVLLPGPNSLYVLAVAARHGVHKGYAGACGVFLGDTTLMLLTALGAASVLQANLLVYNSLRWVGAAYLAYLGLKLIAGAWRSLRHPATKATAPATQDLPDTPPGQPEASSAAVCRKALLISLFNPKAILFFLSFFVQFVDPGYAHPAASFLLLGGIVQTASFLYLSTLIFAGVRLARAFAGRRRLSALLGTVVGSLFIGFGLRLAA
jgi:leucine efflux protein